MSGRDLVQAEGARTTQRLENRLRHTRLGPEEVQAEIDKWAQMQSRFARAGKSGEAGAAGDVISDLMSIKQRAG